MERHRREAATKIKNYQTFHLSGDLAEHISGQVAQGISHFESPINFARPGLNVDNTQPRAHLDFDLDIPQMQQAHTLTPASGGTRLLQNLGGMDALLSTREINNTIYHRSANNNHTRPVAANRGQITRLGRGNLTPTHDTQLVCTHTQKKNNPTLVTPTKTHHGRRHEDRT